MKWVLIVMMWVTPEMPEEEWASKSLYQQYDKPVFESYTECKFYADKVLESTSVETRERMNIACVPTDKD